MQSQGCFSQFYSWSLWHPDSAKWITSLEPLSRAETLPRPQASGPLWDILPLTFILSKNKNGKFSVSGFICVFYCIYTVVFCSFLWLSNIPCYGYATFHLSIHLLMDIWAVFTFQLLWIVLWTFRNQLPGARGRRSGEWQPNAFRLSFSSDEKFLRLTGLHNTEYT